MNAFQSRPTLLDVALLVSVLLCVPIRAETIRVLVVDGQNNHDWAATTQSVKATLLATARFDVSVSTSPPAGAAADEWAKWRPEFSKHAVVLSNYNGDLWPEDVRTAFEHFVREGGGVVFVHAANNAFSGWDEYNKMIGLGWRNSSFGERVTLDADSGRLVRASKGEGPSAGHGPQHAFAIVSRAPDHPILRGMPAQWMHATDELYHGQRGPATDIVVLESAFSDPRKGGTGAHEPITWYVPYGKGRCVTTVLGHHWEGQKDHDALHCVGFQVITARSAEWAATGDVTIGIPAGFPVADKPSVMPPETVRWMIDPPAGKAPAANGGAVK